jgi:hypothetical protein
MLVHNASDFNLHIMANAILFVLLLALACRVLGLRSQQVGGVARSGLLYVFRRTDQ